MRKLNLLKSKKAVAVAMAVTTMALCGACGVQKNAVDSTELTETVMEDTEDTDDTEGDITDGNFSHYAGTYTDEDGDSIEIGEDGSIDITIIRLCSMQGTASPVYKCLMPITVTDPNGDDMDLEFNTETKELYVVDSSWDYLESGAEFVMDK